MNPGLLPLVHIRALRDPARLCDSDRETMPTVIVATGVRFVPTFRPHASAGDTGSDAVQAGKKKAPIGGTFKPNPKTVWRGDAGLRSGPKRQMKNPEDFGGDYDKIREELMTQGYRGWAGSLSISNALNWLSENTFGASGTNLGQGIDAVAGAYRKFLDALPYRRQDGRQARALPKGRAAEAYKRWEAFKAGEAKPDDEGAVVSGRANMLRGEQEVFEYWTKVSEEAEAARKAGKRQKAAGRVGLSNKVGEGRLVLSEGQRRAISADVMALVLSLRRAAAALERGEDASAGFASDAARVDASADEADDRRDELLSGWGGNSDGISFYGGYGAITPVEASEARDAAGWTPAKVAERINDVSALLICTPGDAVACAHRFPAILETPQSVLAARMASLKELLPRADAALIFRAEPRLLLAGDGDIIMENVRRSVEAIKRDLPGINADKLLELEPRMLFEDISSGLEALRELWPEEAFRQSDADNPFFAEELALAIKALNGKGTENQGDRRRSDKSYK